MRTITASAIVGSYFSFSYFSLFELLGIRQGVQLVLIILTSMLCLIILTRVRSIKIDIYAIYIGLIGVFLAAKQVEASMLYSVLYSLFIYVTLINSGIVMQAKVIKYTVNTLMILAILAIAQFFVIAIFGSEVAKDLALFNGLNYGSNNMVFFDLSAYGTNEYPWLRLLGLSDAKVYSFGVFEFFNVRSFIHEPSLALSIFFLPVAVALVTNGGGRFSSSIIILFCALTYSWSIYIALAMTAVLHQLMLIRKILPWIIFSIVFGLLLAIFLYVPPDLSYQIDAYEDVKSESNLTRLMVVSYALHNIGQLFIGNANLIMAPLGMMTYSIYYGGAITFIIGLVVYFNILKWSVKMDNICGMQKIGVAMLIAYMTQMLIINEYGLISPIGLVTLGLLYRFLGDKNKNRIG